MRSISRLNLIPSHAISRLLQYLVTRLLVDRFAHLHSVGSRSSTASDRPIYTSHTCVVSSWKKNLLSRCADDIGILFGDQIKVLAMTT